MRDATFLSALMSATLAESPRLSVREFFLQLRVWIKFGTAVAGDTFGIPGIGKISAVTALKAELILFPHSSNSEISGSAAFSMLSTAGKIKIANIQNALLAMTDQPDVALFGVDPPEGFPATDTASIFISAILSIVNSVADCELHFSEAEARRIGDVCYRATATKYWGASLWAALALAVAKGSIGYASLLRADAERSIAVTGTLLGLLQGLFPVAAVDGAPCNSLSKEIHGTNKISQDLGCERFPTVDGGVFLPI